MQRDVADIVKSNYVDTTELFSVHSIFANNFFQPLFYEIKIDLSIKSDKVNSAISSCLVLLRFLNRESLQYSYVFIKRLLEKNNKISIADILLFLYENGVPTENDMPNYKNITITDDMRTIASGNRINGYVRIPNIKILKKSLLKNGPALIAFPYCENSEYFWRCNEKKGIALIVTGYNDLKSSFIVKSSKTGDETMIPYCDFKHAWECWSMVGFKTSTNKKDSTMRAFFKKIIKMLSDFNIFKV